MKSTPASAHPVSARSNNADKPRLIRIPEKWVWHYAKLQSLRDRLLRNRENEALASATPIAPPGMDMAERAADEFDHEIALCLLSREDNALREVDAALHRIRGGTYGICEESGQAIPPARLRVQPWTRFTKEVQDQHEREGFGAPPAIPPVHSIRQSGGDSPFQTEAIALIDDQEGRAQLFVRERDSLAGVPSPSDASASRTSCPHHRIPKKRATASHRLRARH